MNKAMKQTNKHFKLISIFVFLLIAANTALSQPSGNSRSKHFVLVHGAGHGAWCWYKLVPLLRSSGHNVTAIDLAASGINPLQVNDIRSISDYTRPLRDLLASLPQDEKAILVGHSLGGLVLSQAMEIFPDKISVAVFVTALMPSPSINFSTLVQELSRKQGSQLDNRDTYDDGPNNPPTTRLFGPVYLLSRLYQRSPIQDWTLATTLVRPSRISFPDTAKEMNLTWRRYGSVKRVFIIAEKDLAIPKSFQLWMNQKNPPHEVKEIFGSDHMTMISKPRELWAHLLAISKKHA